jgi:hypothetical protein
LRSGSGFTGLRHNNTRDASGVSKGASEITLIHRKKNNCGHLV